MMSYKQACGDDMKMANTLSGEVKKRGWKRYSTFDADTLPEKLFHSGWQDFYWKANHYWGMYNPTTHEIAVYIDGYVYCMQCETTVKMADTFDWLIEFMRHYDSELVTQIQHAKKVVCGVTSS